MMTEFVLCLECGKGKLLPLSDYGPDGAAIVFKAWVCSNKACSATLRIDKGIVTRNSRAT